MSKISDIVTELTKPITDEIGCDLWDVEYVREAGQWYLRIFIDKADGISIEDCEKVSRELDPILDEKDPIAENYIFEVSSAGLERTLKRAEHFEKFMGHTVEIKLYKSFNDSKLWSGELVGYEKGAVTIKQAEETIRFEKEQMAKVHISLL